MMIVTLFFVVSLSDISYQPVFSNPFGPGIIFLVLAHPVYKMRIKQEPNMIEL